MNLKQYIRAGYPAVAIVTHEEQRATAAAIEIAKELGYTLLSWSPASGLFNITEAKAIDTKMADPVAAIKRLQDGQLTPPKTIMLAYDLHLFINPTQPHPVLVRTIRESCIVMKENQKVLVPVGCAMRLPPELEKEIAIDELKLPDSEQLGVVLDSLMVHSAGLPKATGDARDQILTASAGLTTIEAENVYALSWTMNRSVDPHVVASEKAKVIKKTGLLEIMDTSVNASSIGGLGNLKSWIGRRKNAMTRQAREFGLPIPKGVLVVGLPGTGKSLTAKASASMLGCPLIRLDGGRIFGGIIGQSEANMRRVIETAEACAPCVLFIDEIEKALSGSKSSGQTDGGTTARVFGTFIQWMNDKRVPVFVVATANNIASLPPEFSRKGRWDELFFVDLPDAVDREAIWDVQLKAKGRDPLKFDTAELARVSHNFTGAEIEACVNEALYTAFEQGAKDIDDMMLVAAINETVPLAKTMASELDDMRAWATGRTRPAASARPAEVAARRLVD